MHLNGVFGSPYNCSNPCFISFPKNESTIPPGNYKFQNQSGKIHGDIAYDYNLWTIYLENRRSNIKGSNIPLCKTVQYYENYSNLLTFSLFNYILHIRYLQQGMCSGTMGYCKKKSMLFLLLVGK